jgi:hypothetical protein
MKETLFSIPSSSVFAILIFLCSFKSAWGLETAAAPYRISCSHLLSDPQQRRLLSPATLKKIFGDGWTDNAAESETMKMVWEPVANADPGRFDPNDFRFLAVARGRSNLLELERLEREIALIPEIENLSASLLDSRHTFTFFHLDMGLIIATAPENIVSSYPGDMGNSTRQLKPDEVLAKFGLHTPEALLQGTMGAAWNEVRIKKGREGESSRVTALYYLEGTPEERVQTLIANGTKLGLPVLKLPKPPLQ